MKTNTTPEDLEQIAEELFEIADNLKIIASEMKEAGMPVLSLHSNTQINRDIPSLLSWSYKISSESKIQLRRLGKGRTVAKKNGICTASNGIKKNGFKRTRS